MSAGAEQQELFEAAEMDREELQRLSPQERSDDGWKSIRQRHGADGRYRKISPTVIVADFGRGDLVEASWQPSQGGRWYGTYADRQIQTRAKKGDIRGWLTNAAHVVLLVRQGRDLEAAAKSLFEMSTRHRAELEAYQNGEDDRLITGDQPAAKLPPRKKLSSKLCLEPVMIDWEAKRLVPRECEYSFSKLPIALLEYQAQFAQNEWRVLCAALELGTFSGLVWGKKTWAKNARVDEKDLKWPRRSLVNRGFLRQTLEERDGSPVFELLWHPWYGPMVKSSNNEEGGELSDIGGGTIGKQCPKVPPNQTSPNQTETSDESPARELSANAAASSEDRKRIRAKSRGRDEEKRQQGAFALSRDAYDDDVWRRLFDTLGKDEMQNSGMRWGARLSMERDALNTILSDFEARRGEAIARPAAFLESAWKATPEGRREAARRKQAR